MSKTKQVYWNPSSTFVAQDGTRFDHGEGLPANYADECPARYRRSREQLAEVEAWRNRKTKDDSADTEGEGSEGGE